MVAGLPAEAVTGASGGLHSVLRSMDRDSVRPHLLSVWTALLDLADSVQEAFTLAATVVRRQTPNGQRQMTESHRGIVGQRARIEAACLTLLRQPNVTSAELQLTACAIEIAAELERITRLLRSLVHTPLLTYGDTVQQSRTVVERAVEVSAASIGQTLAGLAGSGADRAEQALSARERVETHFALVYSWMSGAGNSAFAKPYPQRQLMRLAHDYRELANRILNLHEWIEYSASLDARSLVATGQVSNAPSNQNDKEHIS